MNGRDDQIGSGVIFILEQMVQTDNCQTADRKKKNQPWILGAQECDKGETEIKGRSADANNNTNQNGKDHPFDRGDCPARVVFYFMFDQIIHDKNHPL